MISTPTTSQNVAEVSRVFSTYLMWWDEIRKYYKEETYYSMCLEIAYKEMLRKDSEII